MLRGLAGAPLAPARRRTGPPSATGSNGSRGASDTPPPDTGGGGDQTAVSDESTPGSDQVARSRELNPLGLRLEAHEVEAMEQLSSLLGRSPRALKRFVNVYRLFKVREPDVVDFADADRADADYRIVLYLLAEITGRPDTADDLFDAIRAANDDDTTVMKDAPTGWPRTAGAYKPWLDEVGRFSFRAMISCRLQR